MNNKKITNIRLDQTQHNSAATVKMVKDLEFKVGPNTRNNVYREIFEQFYDFSDACNHKLTLGSSGITFTGINPNITLPQRTITHVNVDGLRFQGQTLNLSLSHRQNFTICVVMQLWLNRRFMMEFQVKNAANRPKKLFLETNSGKTHIPLTNDFNGKKVVFWMAENSNANITKAAISNYSSTLTRHSNCVPSGRETFGISSQDTVIYKVMYSPNFYDFDSEQYHKIMVQEKLNGSYIL